MISVYKNLLNTFRRFFTASMLNILGLSIALTSFFVIMLQVDYDYNFNKSYKDYQKIYRVEIHPSAEWGWQIWTPAALLDILKSSSPYVKSVSMHYSFVNKTNFYVGDKLYTEQVLQGFDNFAELFSPEMISGTLESLDNPENIILPESAALRMFGTSDATGKTVFMGEPSDNLVLTVGGVYKDFPENTSFGNNILLSFPKNMNRKDIRNFNYSCYVYIDNPDAVPGIVDNVIQNFVPLFPEEIMNDTDDGSDKILRLTPISEIHFSKVGDKSAGSMSMVYLLISISFLIVIVAVINFMNFYLAETPMRIKSINTQKVLGASVFSLRLNLLKETVLVGLISFVISLLLLLVLIKLGLQEIVVAKLDVAGHPMLLICTFILSLVAGFMAGIYPSYYATSFPTALVLKGAFGLSPKGRVLRTALVSIQFFVSFVLIISVGIMYKQSHYIRTSDYGYDKDAIIIGTTNKETKKNKEAVVNELMKLPGVEGVSFSQFALNSSDNYMNWGRGEGNRHLQFDVIPVDWRYLDVMGIKIIEGRNFKENDGDVYIFNEAAKKKFSWLEIDKPATEGDLPVIGFCENIRYSSFRNDDRSEPLAFIVYGESYKGWGGDNVINIRVSDNINRISVMNDIQNVMEKFNPGFDNNLLFMDEVLDFNYRNELRFTKQMLVFSVIAIVISIIGVLGLTMFESEYRKKEIGLRKIMGSSITEILYMFNKRYILILLSCFVVAAPFGWWIGVNWLEGFSEKTQIGLFVFVLSFLAVLVITVFTVTLQSWKNATENPVNSIKNE